MSSIEEMMKKYPNPAYELEKELEDIEASDISNIKKMELALEAKEDYKKNHTPLKHMNFFGFRDFNDNCYLSYGASYYDEYGISWPPILMC